MAGLQAEYEAISHRLSIWRERAEKVWQEMGDDLRASAPDLDAVEWPEPRESADEDPDPLFDSTRDYVEQIDRYKRHQGRPTSRIAYGSGGGRNQRFPDPRAESIGDTGAA